LRGRGNEDLCRIFTIFFVSVEFLSASMQCSTVD
jgi:hypothetical protein